jgi:outer membrane protein
MNKSFSAVLSVGMLALYASTGAHAADLLSVYRDAVAYDAQFAAAKATVEAGRERLPQGLAGLLPTIGGGASTVWNDNETRPLIVPTATKSQFNTHGWSVNLTQPLFRWQNWVTYNQAELSVAMSEAQFDAARMDLIVRTVQGYFDVLLAQDSFATAQAQKKAVAEQLESAKRNFEVGTTTVTDTHEAQAKYDLVIAQEIGAENDLKVKRYALQSLIGKDLHDLKRLKAGVQVQPPMPSDMSKWVEMAETAAPGVRIAQAGYEIADREVEKQRAGHLPTLDLVATRSFGAQGYNAAALGGVESDTKTIGVQLTVPLFTGGYTNSKSKEAVSLKGKAGADLDFAKRSSALSVRQAYLGVTSGLAQVKAFEAALTSSQSALDSNKLGYEVGVRINIDVLNAQTQLFDTQQKLAKSRLDTIVALLKLKAATGSLTETDLESANALLN